jgi:hypothetical protein
MEERDISKSSIILLLDNDTGFYCRKYKLLIKVTSTPTLRDHFSKSHAELFYKDCDTVFWITHEFQLRLFACPKEKDRSSDRLCNEHGGW